MTLELNAGTPVEAFEKYVRGRHDRGEDVEIQYTEALTDELMKAMAALIDAAPRTSVRIYSVGDGGPDFNWLRGLEKLRHLKVQVARATSFEPLARFSELRTLRLGDTISKRPSLSVLASFPQLIHLEVDGHVKGAEAISELKHLRFLGVGGARDEQWLRRVGPHPTIERLTIGAGSIRDLGTLPEYPNLKDLYLRRIFRFTDEHLHPIAACRNLRKLGLDELKHVYRLPDLSGGPAETLQRVDIGALQNLETVTGLLSLKRLEQFWLSTVPRDERIRGFREMVGLHLHLYGRYPEAEIQALVDGYKGASLEYQNKWLVGTRASNP